MNVLLSRKGKPPRATGTEVHSVDLALPRNKKPTALDTYSFAKPEMVDKLIHNYAIGSSKPNQKVFFRDDLGLFQTVYEAWKNHWNLRTSPEDWWFPVACRIAKAIDEAAKWNDKVRKHFVPHQEKENICVDVDVFTIYDVDYDSFFALVASEIESRIKVPKYANAMQNDFSTSTGTHHIESQINLMASMQEFFSYEMGLCGCGIKGIEMLGKQEDWDRLVPKLRQLKEQLEPILSEIYLGDDWFNHVEHVFSKLANTYSANDKSKQMVTNFWANIFMVGEGWKYGPSGFGGHKVDDYNGWLVQFLTGHKSIHQEDFFGMENKEKLKGLNTVPMKVTMKFKTPPVSDQSELVAGIMGFQLHQDTFNNVPSLQPHHMWALKLPLNSPVR